MKTNYPFRTAKEELKHIILNATDSKLNQVADIVQIWKDNDNMALYPTQKYKNVIKH